ncbi:hypothetical protein JCM6882_002334 [Rhodosporidiobolus microsporus]
MSAPAASTSTSTNAPQEPPARAQLLPTTPPATRSSSLRTASTLLHASLSVAFPTETVYGLGASALSSTAVKRIFSAKGRPSDNPLIVHVSSRAMLDGLLPTHKDGGGKVALPKMYDALMDAFWPGALSLVFPLAHLDPKGKGKATDYDPPRLAVAPEVTAGHASLCVRMPSHPLALDLIRESDLPLAAPSANLSSRPSPTSAAHVMHDLGEGRGVGAVLDGGECEVGVESTVVDWVPPAEGEREGGEGALRILRAGGVTAEEIEACLQKAGFATTASSSSSTDSGAKQVQVYARDFRNQDLEDKPTTPGMKYKHYAPGNAKVVLVKPVRKEDVTDDLGPLPSLQDLVQLTALTHAKVEVDDEGRTVEVPFRVGLMLTEETLEGLKAEVVSSSSSSAADQPADSSAPSSEVRYDTLSLPPPPPSLFSTLSLGEDSNLPDLSSLSILSSPLGSQSRPIEAAQRLFGGLRLFDSLDGEGVDLILVEAVREEGVGLAVMERARKAAGGTERGGEMEFLL